MTGIHNVPPVERPITRLGIETSIGLAWNSEGERKGLPPLAWKLGDAFEGVHFAGNADAYALEMRCEIIESWIAALGLADLFDLIDDPLQRVGAEMIWTGTIDGVTFQFSYPAGDGI
jgi:hypothetical protein